MIRTDCKFAMTESEAKEIAANLTTLERIPPIGDPGWPVWCQERNVDRIGGPRRAWWAGVGTYIRDAQWAVQFGERYVGVI